MGYRMKLGADQVSIASYLVVYPFEFMAGGEGMVPLPNMAVCFVDAVTTRLRAGQHTQETERVQAHGDFVISQEGGGWLHNVVEMREFDFVWASTPASLDRSRALWVLCGSETAGVGVGFDPRPYEFLEFGADYGTRSYWGATLEGFGASLKASLSVPVYDMEHGSVAEYYALGPAASGPKACIFEKIASLGGLDPATGRGLEVELPGALTVTDERRQTSNIFFEDRGQLGKDSFGAVFAMNGRILHARWESVREFVRRVVEARVKGGDVLRLVATWPAEILDETVAETMQPAGEAQSPQAFGITTPDFEGIGLWCLKVGAAGQDVLHR